MMKLDFRGVVDRNIRSTADKIVCRTITTQITFFEFRASDF